MQDSEPISYCFPNVSLDCFTQISDIPRLNSTNISYALPKISLNMLNNNAQIAGSSIYGGSLDSCTINVEYTTTTVQLSILSLNWTELNLDLEPNSISSDPFQVCMCEDGIPNCST